MNTPRSAHPARIAALVAATALALILTIAPAQATEAGGGGEEGQPQKMQIAETPHEKVGLLILGALVVGGGLAFVNARKQLKGERDQASGEFRWR